MTEDIQKPQADPNEQPSSKPSQDEKETTSASAAASGHRFDTNTIIPGATVRVSQKIKEGEKERVQTFEGLIIGKNGRSGVSTTITVRKVSHGVGVERIFPLALPTITNIEVVKQARVRRAKLSYMRDPKARKLREVKK